MNRIVERLLDSEVPLRPREVILASRRIAQVEAPLEPDAAISAAMELVGLGVLEPLLADPEVSDVLVNAPDEVWIERRGALERADVRFSGPEAVVAAVERVIAPLGLRLDRASPAVDARLPDGSRLHAIIPPAAVDGPAVAIRRFVAVVETLDDLVEQGALAREAASLLEGAVIERRNLLVSGGTGSGKTTLLNVLSRAIANDERVVTIEDAAELRLSGHVVRLEARPPNAEGAGEITLRTLVRHALRMRPDRIVVGEVRGSEAFDLIQAMSTGHAGSMGTVHANGPEEALWRLETLALTADRNLPAEAVRRMLRSAIDLIVQLERRDGHRQIVAMSEVGTDGVRRQWP
ncbi:MAG TPA: CpaF family protein [Acidimicrobiia bacterium]|nr:CpaF family protein [Acidimicrobiia bacterium]